LNALNVKGPCDWLS